MLDQIKSLNFISQWGWMQYSVLVLALAFTISEVYDRHSQRIKPVTQVSIETMEEDIQEFNTMAEQLGQLEKLPPVSQQWSYAAAVTRNFQVMMKPIEKSKSTYRGPLASWSGVLSGQTGQVLAAAKKIQETVPTYLYGFSINGNQSQITFSVLGSE